jgi:hypothetical protein
MPKIIEPVEQTTDGFLEYVRKRSSYREDAKTAASELGGLASAYIERHGDSKLGLSMAVKLMELPREKAADALRTFDAYLPYIRARIAEQADLPLETKPAAAPEKVTDIERERKRRTKAELDQYEASAS